MALSPALRPVVALLLAAAGAGTLVAQVPSRNWDARSRTLITDLSRVQAVAATQALVFAATPEALAIYDRSFRALREIVGAADGYPAGTVTAIAADPTDDAVWVAGRNRWGLYRSFSRTWDSGSLPGTAEMVVLDARDPARGAFIRVAGRWYFLSKGAGIATPATDVPPPGRRLGTLTPAELRQRAPAFDAVRLRIERDEMLRTWPLTSAAAGPVASELYVGTDGNGLFEVDPTTYRIARFPVGLVGPAVGAVALGRDLVCAGSDDRLGTRRRGITCQREDLSDAVAYEQGQGLAALPGTEIRRLAVTERGLWAATDAGLLFIDRRGRLDQVSGADDLPSNDVTALLTRRGGVWVGTTFGLAFVADTARRLTGDPAGVAASVHALAVRGDTLWMASSTGVLARPAAPESTSGVAVLVVAGQEARDDAPAIAAGPGGILAAQRGRLVWVRDTAQWLATPPGDLGEVRVIAADGQGFWVGGTRGLGYALPARGVWPVLLNSADLPLPVNDLAVSRRWVWVATDRGLVRFDRDALLP